MVYVWWVSHTGSSRSPMVNQPVRIGRIGAIEAVDRDRTVHDSVGQHTGSGVASYGIGSNGCDSHRRI